MDYLNKEDEMKKIITLLMTMIIGLVGCSNVNTELAQVQTSESNMVETEKSKEDTSISEDKIARIGGNIVSIGMLEVAKPIFEENSGYKMEIVMFDDVIQPNIALEEGSIDANFYQHKPYLQAYNKDMGKDLTFYNDEGSIHMLYGMYSDKIGSVSEIKEGDTIAIVNNPSNAAIGLKLLEQEGLIKLDPSAEMPGLTDITEKIVDIDIIELGNGRVIIESLPNVTAGITAGIDAANANMDPRSALAIATGTLADEVVIGLTVTQANKDLSWGDAFVETMKSEELKKFYEENLSCSVWAVE